ncbi:hypothetical protein PMAYCL1PPCAC_06509, partial [Pristionchus mayeri]
FQTLFRRSTNRSQHTMAGAIQTTTIETKSVVRPLKVISLVCLSLGVILMIIALCSTWWLKSGTFRTGLFLECTSTDENARVISPLLGAPQPGKCHKPDRDNGFMIASAVLLIVALVCTVIAFFLNVCGLMQSDARRKYHFYRVATWIAILSVLLSLTALILFPAAFYVKMKDYGARREWEVDWSYGIAWGATLFTFGASLLLICDKEHEEVYYKEKTVYNPPPELN